VNNTTSWGARKNNDKSKKRIDSKNYEKKALGEFRGKEGSNTQGEKGLHSKKEKNRCGDPPREKQTTIQWGEETRGKSNGKFRGVTSGMPPTGPTPRGAKEELRE